MAGKKIIEQEYEAEVDISTLLAHPQNPNRGDEKAILESIQTVGFYGAVIAQKSTRIILVGEHRWRSAKRAKAKTIPVIWVEATDLEAIRIMLADNRTADLARYKEAEKTALLQTCVDKFGGSFIHGTGYSKKDVTGNQSIISDLTRNAVKDAVSGKNAHHAQKTSIKFSVGRIKFLVDNEDCSDWLDRVQQEAKEKNISPEELVAERMGVDLCQ